jgi:1-acyl-sn-glycerol-3-phosphate acyltransferase
MLSARRCRGQEKEGRPVPRRKLGFWLRFAAMILRPPVMLLTKRDWRGAEHLPKGGAVVVVNHISYFDPLAFSHFIFDNGISPRFLAKSSLFEIPFVGRVLRGAGQIPVHRKSRDAASSFRDAVAAVRRGECVCVYAEGTVTRDPGLWPMTGKTGAARIALTTGAPVIPVAQWGAQELLPPYAKRPNLFPRKTMHLIAGPPVDLSEYEGKDPTGEVLRDATAKIMDAITALLEELRGEQAPAERFDMRKHRVPETGNPAKTAEDESAKKESA